MKKIIFGCVFLTMCVATNAGWEKVEAPQADINILGLDVLGAEEIWMCGSAGFLANYKNSVWTVVPPVTSSTLHAIEMVSSEEGWCTGELGTILHFVEGAWTAISDINSELNCIDIGLVSSSDVYFIAYGFIAGGIVFHWDGAAISEVFTKPGANIQSIAHSGPDNIFICGSSNLRIFYDGTTWQEDSSSLPESMHLRGACMDEEGLPVICANLADTSHWDHGRILTRTKSGEWVMLYSDWAQALLFDIDIKETVGFAVGEKGALFENTIFGWKKNGYIANSQLNRVQLFDMSRGWAVGAGSNVVKFLRPAIDLKVSERIFQTGDSFKASYQLLNPGETVDVDLFIILEAFDQFYFWPTYSTEVNYETVTIPADSFEETTFLEFEWPEIGSAADGLKFWGAILYQGEVLSYDTETFGWE